MESEKDLFKLNKFKKVESRVSAFHVNGSASKSRQGATHYRTFTQK